MITLHKKVNCDVTELTKKELSQIDADLFPHKQYKLITNDMLEYLNCDMFFHTWCENKFSFTDTTPKAWLNFFAKSKNQWTRIKYQMLETGVFPPYFIEENLQAFIDSNFGWEMGTYLIKNKHIKISDMEKYEKLSLSFKDIGCIHGIDKSEIFEYLKKSNYLSEVISDYELEEYPIMLLNEQLKELGLNEIPELSLNVLKHHNACVPGLRYAGKLLKAMDTQTTSWNNLVEFLDKNPDYMDQEFIAWIFGVYNDSEMFNESDFVREEK